MRRAARNFAISSKKSMWRVEEERQAGRELLDVEPAGQAELHVGEAVGERERQLLRGGRAGLADVVAGDRDRLVRRDLLGAVLHQVADQAQVRLGGEQPLLLRDVLLEDVGLQRAVELADVDALALGGDQVHAEHRDGGAADRHRRRRLAERDAVEEHVHVGGGVDRRRRSGRPRRGCAGRRSRGPSGSACRTRPRARRRPRPGSSCSARWSAGRCRSRRTAGWSTPGRGSRWRTGRG